MTMTERELADTVVIDPGIKPEDIRGCLIDNVNLAWKAGGNDGRCNIAANFVGWMLQENDRLRAALTEWSADEGCGCPCCAGAQHRSAELLRHNEQSMTKER